MLNPFPEGWFFVAQRKAIERSGLLQRTWLGNEVVAWCNDAGDVCVAEAVCPHLGADLSPDAGGTGAKWLPGLSVSRVCVRCHRPMCRDAICTRSEVRQIAGVRNKRDCGA